MLETSTLLAYLLASIAIILAPGPAQALVLTRSVSEGKKAGILTAIGLNIGTLFHTGAAALGLSAILATSALAFAVVRYPKQSEFRDLAATGDGCGISRIRGAIGTDDS